MRNDVVLSSGGGNAVPSAGAAASHTTAGGVDVHHDGQTRDAVVNLLVEDGPLTAGEIGERLGISAAGVRRHLDALTSAGDIEVASTGFGQRGRGRPAKWFQLTPEGRGKMRHAYDDLAGAAMRKLRDLGGHDAVADFARERVERIVAEVSPSTGPVTVSDTVEEIADALTSAGYATNTRQVGNGMQICQHHCPVAHVAAEFPELCEAETAVFTELLGTHVQRLATIANGDCACTTHVPIHPPPESAESPPPDISQTLPMTTRKATR
ncbi:metalloregulator ArsR/SmtB family transcription factor [Gordonia westfalica]|uniref:Metalloregulator ArsR/SmtB family transcription factor n=1 Tax=Gordonia westfalica TaxID=158898 RepID=A0ABU2GQE2_9ACTN|nr:metalloregulator ArsR/SmtB family transcription factor [Gordonia westfalica]MDS1113688.1 metalloregulator ArsR/SmtB family transcription factor [Gordonia westfalica]